MADYHASFRSNRFRVRDTEALRTWAATRPELICEIERGHAVIACREAGAHYGLPDQGEPEKTTPQPVCFFHEVGPHVAPGAVAVMIEVGAEKLRYLAGLAFAIRGNEDPQAFDIASLSLSDIYGHAAEVFAIPEIAIARAEG